MRGDIRPLPSDLERLCNVQTHWLRGRDRLDPERLNSRVRSIVKLEVIRHITNFTLPYADGLDHEACRELKPLGAEGHMRLVR